MASVQGLMGNIFSYPVSPHYQRKKIEEPFYFDRKGKFLGHVVGSLLKGHCKKTCIYNRLATYGLTSW